MSEMETEVYYRLFTSGRAGTQYSPVVTTAHKAIEAAIIAADARRRVAYCADRQSQAAALKAHVAAAPLPSSIEGYEIDFVDVEESIWDDRNGGWVKVWRGASITYSLAQPGQSPSLFLEVRTKEALTAPSVVPTDAFAGAV